MIKSIAQLVFASMLVSIAACADEQDEKAGAAQNTATPKVADIQQGVPDGFAQTLSARLSAIRDNLTVTNVSSTPAQGVYRVEINNGGVIYALASGDHFIAGELFEIGDNKIVNISEQDNNVKRRALLASVPVSDMIVFPAQGATKANITIFTDVDCGYCRKLHQEVPALNKLGVEVRYLAYPRAGVGSASFDKIATAWCAEDKLTALTKLKNRETLPNNVCEGNPVAAHLMLGQKFGVSGTPAIVFDSGELLPGYLPADQIASRLGI